jgi:retron-type reverse transcriptase
MSLFDNLCSRKNLELAWRRIGTGTSHFYKRFYRHLYNAYEIGLEQNLTDLRKRLKGGSYSPETPIRIYLPKPSKLQRPISLLSLEDQIVWQAMANIFALKLYKQRKSLELKSIYSNVLNPEKESIFFVQRWQQSYGEFQERIKSYFDNGYRWIAHFDLAAYYDTICHELLLRTIVPNRDVDRFVKESLRWLETWSSGNVSRNHKHGIPQGLIASDFLADCFMLPIDKELQKEFKYVRYCDDIRLFARSEKEAMKAAIRLEVFCRERGLIPQVKKHEIKEAMSEKEAMGSLPSISPNIEKPDEYDFRFGAKKSVKILRSALSGKPFRIADKTRVRYILFNAEPSAKLLGYVLKLLPHHPEHIDVFAYYLNHYKRSKKIIRVCCELAMSSPYEYVQGELWHIMARMMTAIEMKKFLNKARQMARSNTKCFMLKWGACHFLCQAERMGLGRQSKYAVGQKTPLLKSLLVSVMPDSFYLPNGDVAKVLKEKDYEPSLALASEMIKKDLKCRHYDITAGDLASQSRNVFQKLGLVRGRHIFIDPMGEIMTRRFGVIQWDGWRKLFGTKYWHSLQILAAGDPLYDVGRSEWLKLINSFNDSLFHVFQRFLHNKGLSGAILLTYKKNGKSIPYGKLVEKNGAFDLAYPNIAGGLRGCNERRNSLPSSHPYTDKGGRTKWLTSKEQKTLHPKLKTAYREIIKITQANLK